MTVSNGCCAACSGLANDGVADFGKLRILPSGNCKFVQGESIAHASAYDWKIPYWYHAVLDLLKPDQITLAPSYIPRYSVEHETLQLNLDHAAFEHDALQNCPRLVDL